MRATCVQHFGIFILSIGSQSLLDTLFCLVCCSHVLHQCPNDGSPTYLPGTLQCPNSSVNATSSPQRYSNVLCNWKPIYSSCSILSCERLEFIFNPFWILVYAFLMSLHQCPNDGLFAKMSWPANNTLRIGKKALFEALISVHAAPHFNNQSINIYASCYM